LFVLRTIIAKKMLQASVKSAQKSKKGKDGAPVSSSIAASAETRPPGSNNDDLEWLNADPIHVSPTQPVNRGVASPTNFASAKPSSRQKAALEVWNHAERVRLGLASPIKAMKLPQASKAEGNPPSGTEAGLGNLSPSVSQSSANAELQQLLGSASNPTLPLRPQNFSGQLSQAQGSVLEEVPSILSDVQRLRQQISAAVAATYRSTPSGEPHIHNYPDFRPDIYTAMANIEAQRPGPVSAAAIAHQQILHEMASLRAQMLESQRQLQEQQALTFTLSQQLRNQGNDRDHPIIIGSQSRASSLPQASPHLVQQCEFPDANVIPVPADQLAARQQQRLDKGFSEEIRHSPRNTSGHPSDLAPAAVSPRNTSSHPPDSISAATKPPQFSNLDSGQAPSVPRQDSDDAAARKLERTIYKRQQSVTKANAQDEAIIKQLQARIKRRSDQEPKLTIRVKKGTAPSRAEEKRLAVLSGDKELLRHGSFRCKKEDRSEDDEEHVQSEVSEAIKAHNRLNPKDLKRTMTKYGHAKNDFVADSDSEVSRHSHDDEDEDEEGDDNEGEETDDNSEHSDPNDPEWLPGNTPTPSPSRKSISKADYELFKAFKRGQQSGKPQQDSVSHITVAVAEQPPEHGEWDDIHHLMTTFKDKHTTYAHRCGSVALSVWNCYSSTAKENIIEQLRSTPQGRALNRTAEYLAKLSNEAFYALLQQELGLSIDTEVEQALKAVRFKGGVLDVPSWVTFRTSWRQALSRATKSDLVQPNRLSELFRNAIPDKFIVEWFDARKHLTWSEIYDTMLNNLDDPRWLVSYNKAMREHAATPAQKGGAAAPGNSTTSGAKTSKPSSAQPPPASDSKETPADKSAPQEKLGGFDPLKYKNSYNVKNVNPNFKRSLNENPDNTPCTRCIDYTHRWGPEFCTVAKRKDGTPIEPALNATEFATRLKGRWDKGFFFSTDLHKDISKHKSPSAREAAHAASSASKKLNHRDE
jgi:hypothetical protein